MLRTTHIAVTLSSAVALAGLVACQQERAPEPAARSANQAAPTTPAPATASNPADASLPTRGTPPSPETKVDNHAATTEITKGESNKAMPLEGQVNNYSSDAFAKRGDERVSREASPPNDTTTKQNDTTAK
jgi:hypothetical protein